MPRVSPTFTTLRALFARSGNQCAFPGCNHPLVDEDGLFVAQVCHIEAAAPNGPRYNPNHTDDQRRSGDNLVLLCYAHHRKTDNVDAFPVEALAAMKANHESRFGRGSFVISDILLASLAAEQDQYWELITAISRLEGPSRPFPMAVEPLSFNDILEEIHRSVDFLGSVLESTSRQEADRDWLSYRIGAPNHRTRVTLLLAQAAVRYYEQRALTDPMSLAQLTDAREALQKLASTLNHVD